MKPGIYPGLSMAEYLALPAVSSGVIRAMTTRCPKAAWHESYLNPDNQPSADDEAEADNAEDDDSTEAANIGTIAHSIILENSTANIAVIDPRQYPAKTTGSIPTGWTNVAIRAVRDEAIARGMTPILLPKMAKVNAMVASARAYIEALKKRQPAIWHAFEADYGQSEVTMVWHDDGVPCRMRPDRISADHRVAIHLKTTKANAEPDAFGRGVFTRMGYDLTGAFYRRGMRKSAHFFLIVEQTAPYLCSLIAPDSERAAYADAQVERAMQLWRECVRRNDWPDYPADVAYLGLPAFQRGEMEEIATDEASGIPYDPAILWGKEAA